MVDTKCILVMILYFIIISIQAFFQCLSICGILQVLDAIIIYVYVIARAGVIFGIYFTSCRYSDG